MKKTILFALFLTITSTANASWWYLINKDEQVVAVQDGPAKIENLEKDGLFQVKVEDYIDLSEAEYRNNKISKHTKTSKELADEQTKKDLKNSVTSKLKGLGLTDEEISVLKEIK